MNRFHTKYYEFVLICLVCIKRVLYNNLYLLGCSGQSSRAGVGGPRIKSQVLLDDERNWQFSSSAL